MKKWLVVGFSVLTIIYFIFIYFLFQKEIQLETSIDNNLVLNVNESFSLPQTNALYCGKIFSKNCINISNYLKEDNNINIHELGNYQINYSVTYKGKSTTETIDVEVKDLEAPNIQLNDTSKLKLCPGSNGEDVNDYTVTDNYDDNITVTKYIKDNKIYYSAIDSSGNSSIVSKEIELVDEKGPTITLNGNSNIYLLKGNSYKELGATAIDNCEGDISKKIVISGAIDTNKVGTYSLVYKIKDSYGNESSAIRKIHIYEHTNNNVTNNGKIIYLTFDDGPNSNTKKILEILDKYQVKATFFVTNQFSNYQYLIEDIYKKGHAIGIHTYSHNYKKIYKSEEAFFEDLYKIDEIIYKYTNTHTKLTRFPGGSSNTISKFNKGIITRLSKQLQEKGYVYFDWNVDSKDTSTTNSQKIANNVINGIKNKSKSVVLMHDIKPANGQALEKIITYALSNGYTFLPLDESSPTAHHRIAN